MTVGRFQVAAFSQINTHFAEYGAIDNNEQEEQSMDGSVKEREKRNPFGVRFAVLFNDKSNKIPAECMELNRGFYNDEVVHFHGTHFKN